MGKIRTRGLPRLVTTIDSRVEATCSQISDSFAFASKIPTVSTDLSYWLTSLLASKAHLRNRFCVTQFTICR